MSLFAMTVMAATAIPSESAVPTDVAKVERAVLEYRRAIQRCQMIFTQSTYLNGAMAPDEERKTTIWFDGKQIRNDLMLRYKKDEQFHREVWCRNCELEGYFLQYSDLKAENDPIALSLYLMKPEMKPDTYAALDPRLLGMVVENSPNLSLARSRLDSCIDASNRQQVAMRHDSWKGMDCLRIDYRRASGSRAAVRIWIVPGWGPSVGRIEMEGDNPGRHFVYSVESDYRQVGKANIWFPQSCVYERRVNGQPEEKEEAKVQVVSLNEPLSPDVFRLAGMDIPAGWPVDGLRKGGMSTWNGKEIEAKAPPAPPKLPPQPARNMRWFYAVYAISLAVLGAAAVYFYFRIRKPRATPRG